LRLLSHSFLNEIIRACIQLVHDAERERILCLVF
jgi:hypothetical protein